MSAPLCLWMHGCTLAHLFKQQLHRGLACARKHVVVREGVAVGQRLAPDQVRASESLRLNPWGGMGWTTVQYSLGEQVGGQTVQRPVHQNLLVRFEAVRRLDARFDAGDSRERRESH